jgi:oligopeptide transport system substrate-binding protein
MGIVSDPESELGADLRSAVPLCTAYVAFDTSRPPFDDPNVRRAFALAVDGQQYEERAMTDGSLRARGLLPPGMPGFGEAVRGVSFDPEAARAQLAQSPYANGELPPIKLTTSGYGFYLDPGVGVLVQMWQETLGATITIDQLEPGGFAETWRGSERGQLFFHEWCADYPDPENMLDALFHSESQQNIGRYGNPDLDSLLERARVEADVSERLSLYGEAEQLLLDDAAAVVLSHRVQTMLVEPRVSGVVAAPGHVAVERYLKLEPAQDE